MELYTLLKKRDVAGKPIRVGVIGTGIYGSMFLSQLKFIPGMQLVCVAELQIEKARQNCIRAGWSEEAISIGNSASAINEAFLRGRIALTEDSTQLIHANVDVVVEITGISEVGTKHAWSALEAGKHVVMVTAETDALLGIALKKLAEKNRVVYSLGYGDEPACICEQIDWARTAGFEVVCAGKGVKYNIKQRYSTPETGWKYQGLTEDQVATGSYNLKMYNSFADGTKSVTEMCSVANACNLVPQAGGLKYPAIEYDDLPNILKPQTEGGILEHSGTIELLSSEKRDGTPLNRSLRWDTYVVFKGRSEYVKHHLINLSGGKRIIRDSSGNYSMINRPIHILGLELGISIASIGLFGAPTGSPNSFVADVAALAKKDLKPGDVLDGEGGYTVYGQLVPAEQSLKGRYLPMGLCNKTKLTKHVAKDSIVTYDDILLDEARFSYKIRKEIEEEYNLRFLREKIA
jgi:predicted homoserine dehydrogenase-like protein